MVEKHLWEEVQNFPIEEVHQEFEYGVVNPCSMTGRVTTYERMIMLYWVIMNFIPHVSLFREAKKGEMKSL